MRKLFCIFLTSFLLSILLFACSKGTIVEEPMWAIGSALICVMPFLYHQRKKRLYKEQLDNERRIREQREKLNREFRKSICWQALVSGKGVPTEGEWVELDICMEQIYPDMVRYLKQAKIDDENLRLCYLLKTGLPDKQTGILLNLSSTALSKRKSRLHQRLTNGKESAKGLDLFLNETFESFY